MSDIIVRRVPGASVQEAFLTSPLTIAVVGRSRGTKTATTVDSTRGLSPTYIDSFPSHYDDGVTSITKIRSVGTITTPDVSGHTDETFYAGIHFVMQDVSGNILDSTNLGDKELPTDVYINWGYAPVLTPPVILSLAEGVAAGGEPGLTASGTYLYKVAVVDRRGIESPPGPSSTYTIVTTGGSIVVIWNKVEYADGYVVYRTLSGTTKYQSISGKRTITLTDDDDTEWIVLPVGKPETVNITKAIPNYSDAYQINFSYGAITYNTFRTFYSYDEVVTAHGIGSELSNLARIYMQASFNGAPVFATVVPKGTTLADYQAAAEVFKANHVQFIVPMFAGSAVPVTFASNLKPFYDLAAALSDPETYQLECYVVSSLPWVIGQQDSDVATILTALQATGSHGKRGFLGVPEGLQVVAQSWVDTDGSYASNYTITDPSGIDITSIAMAGAALAKYCGMRDLAEPLTEKDVSGFIFLGNKWTKDQRDNLTDDGTMVLRNKSGTAVCDRFVNMSLGSLGTLEDGEGNICIPEDWIKGDLREAFLKYRGKKMLTPILRAAKRTLFQKLDQYIDAGTIFSYDPDSVVVTQDSGQLDRIRGYFEYTPVYPINKAYIEYNFVVNLAIG